MKTAKKSAISILLALIIALTCIAPAFAEEAPEVINVNFSYNNGKYVLTNAVIPVYDGISEEYGYQVSSEDHNGKPVDGITVLDVIVAAHKEYYGDDFTARTAQDYLGVSYGYLSMVFGESTALGFTVNNAQPHDDIFVEAYNGYTGYAADTAVVNEGDNIYVYTYQDGYWADYYPVINGTEEAFPGDTVSVDVYGYSIGWYGYSKDEDISGCTVPLEGAEVSITTDFKTFESVGTVPANGILTYTAPETGEYYIVVSGTYTDSYGTETPIIQNCIHLIVFEPLEEPQNGWFITGISAEIFEEENETPVFNVYLKRINIFNLLLTDYKKVLSVNIKSEHSYKFAEFMVALFDIIR